VSCFAVHCKGAGAQEDPALVPAMLARMKCRAPDGDDIARVDRVVLAQAHLRTGGRIADGPHRLTLDGRVWLVADARIDARDGLIGRLRAAGRDVDLNTPHAELALHAYHVFGDEFVDHLLGDFALVLWDARRQRLLAVRDPLGVRPLYFARIGDELALASDISGLLALPQLSRELDRTAIGDFLMCGTPLDADATIYREVRCLGPGSVLEWTRGEMRIRRYWTPHAAPEVRFRRRGDYVDRFRELLRLAVADRVPEGAVAIPLSGGMDSTSIAALAAESAPAGSITAYHVSARALEPGDDEAPYAREVADRLGLRYVHQELGDYALFDRARSIGTAFPSPAPMLAVHADMVSDMAQHDARVLLSGYQGDVLFFAKPTYYSGLLRAGRWFKFAREAAHHVRHARSLRGMSLRTLWQPASEAPPWKPALPAWLHPQFVRELDLHARWEHWWSLHERAVDPVAQLQLPWAQRAFEALEIVPGPMVARYPFLDLRLVRFALGLPAFMSADKAILREAMRGHLPTAVLQRPKTGAAGDPVRKLAAGDKLIDASCVSTLASEGFIEPRAFETAWQRYREGEGSESTWASWLILHPIALTNWLEVRQESSR
jgi:asparagine synthase (glutamine-hydrolysing)